MQPGSVFVLSVEGMLQLSWLPPKLTWPTTLALAFFVADMNAVTWPAIPTWPLLLSA